MIHCCVSSAAQCAGKGPTVLSGYHGRSAELGLPTEAPGEVACVVCGEGRLVVLVCVVIVIDL